VTIVTIAIALVWLEKVNVMKVYAGFCLQKGVWRGSDVFYQHVRCDFGDGQRIHFWLQNNGLSSMSLSSAQFIR